MEEFLGRLYMEVFLGDPLGKAEGLMLLRQWTTEEK